MILNLLSQVEGVQEEAQRLRAAYAGDKEREINNREQEVLDAWNNLKMDIQGRSLKLDHTSDLYRFLNMVRSLMLWMDDIILQITSQEKARWVEMVFNPSTLVEKEQFVQLEHCTR